MRLHDITPATVTVRPCRDFTIAQGDEGEGTPASVAIMMDGRIFKMRDRGEAEAIAATILAEADRAWPVEPPAEGVAS